MKILRIFLTCLAFLWLGIYLYVDTKFQPHSLNWLASKLFGYLFIFAALIFNWIQRRENSKWSILFAGCVWALMFTYYGYKDIHKYKNNVCLDKFGLEFNNMRRSRGVPVIPAGWHERYRVDREDEWTKKDSLPGHYQKRISVDSVSCTLTEEYDEYDLNKAINGKSRDLEIRTKFANDKETRSIIFRYYDGNGDTSRVITKQKADSIFAAEKIKKDY